MCHAVWEAERLACEHDMVWSLSVTEQTWTAGMQDFCKSCFDGAMQSCKKG